MIIDCHCHAGKGDGLTGPWDTSAPLEGYLRRATAAGIDRTVLFPAFHSDYAVANREVARIVAGRPDRFFGFAFINPERDRGRVADLVREAVGRHGFRGIKVHRYDARITREICEVARLPAAGPLRCHGRGLGRRAAGGRVPRRDLHHPAPGQLRRRLEGPAGLDRPAGAAPQYLHRHLGHPPLRHPGAGGAAGGRGKILFGSDGPWLHPGLELAKVRALGLSAADERLVLGLNWLRLTSRVRTRLAHRVAITVRTTLASIDRADPWLSEQAGVSC